MDKDMDIRLQYAIRERGESCIMSKWYQGDLFQKYASDEKKQYVEKNRLVVFYLSSVY